MELYASVRHGWPTCTCYLGKSATSQKRVGYFELKISNCCPKN